MCVLLTLPPDAWNEDVIARAPAAHLGHEAVLEVESTC